MKRRISLLMSLFCIAVMGIQAQSDYAHSDETEPDYGIVFPQDAVNTMSISISPENWQTMMDNMTELYGEFANHYNVQVPNEGQGVEPSPAVSSLSLDVTENPIWVEADIHFAGETWSHVGMRFKGSSSLASAWGSGNYKLGFRLNFDRFEDNYPEIDNQRFYGFDELSFSSNWSDASFLREKVTADIFREAGLVSAQTAFYAVYVDYGEGAIYFGLYTAVELIEDTVLDTQFSDNDGNLYKPEGIGATFAAGTFDEASFDKETNEDEADFSDIQALFAALHAESRISDPEAWRSELEAVFAVDTFMHWLAVNTLVQNWDTYGTMAHNYYLYNDPTTGQLTWIPLDNNMALSSEFGGGSGGMGLDTSNLRLDSVGADWPLIRFLMDDPIYYALYVSYIDETINGAFEPSKMEATYRYYHELIMPYVIGENGEIENHGFLRSDEAFSQALDDLISHVNERYALAQDFLNQQ